MAHQLTIRPNGFAEIALARQPAWHGLGTVLPNLMTSEEALTAAGLDWQVEKRPLYRKVGDQFVALPQEQILVRVDNEEVLGVVTDHYRVVQNVEGFRWLDALVEQDQLRYEAAFSLQGGRKVVLLARTPGYGEVLPSDVILPYILFILGHDGRTGIRCGPVAVRVVCANTLRIAEQTYELMRVSHIGDVSKKLEYMRQIMKVYLELFTDYITEANRLANRKLSEQEVQLILDRLFPVDKSLPLETQLALHDKRYQIMQLFTQAETNNLPGMERTAWSLFCAIVEYIDHGLRGAAESRVMNSLFTVGARLKKRAWETIKQLVFSAA